MKKGGILQQAPYYYRLGKKFNIHTKRFLGPVVISPEAVFAVVKIDPVPLRNVFLGNTASVFECDLSELPETITRHPDWLLRRRKTGRTFIFPRTSVRRVKSSVWGYLYLETNELNLRVDVSMFRARKVRRYLRNTGWPLD